MCKFWLKCTYCMSKFRLKCTLSRLLILICKNKKRYVHKNQILCYLSAQGVVWVANISQIFDGLLHPKLSKSNILLGCFKATSKYCKIWLDFFIQKHVLLGHHHMIPLLVLTKNNHELCTFKPKFTHTLCI